MPNRFVFILFFLGSSYLYANSHHPQVFLDEIKGRPDEGGQIVQHFCASCHAEKPLIELGAPKIANENDWSSRLVNRDIENLIKNTIEGLNAMPPRGGCFECTDEQLKAAVIQLLPNKLKEKEYKKNK
ncbi:MAG: c-type cytochrome [Proteobacteria bacterium]|nr:c-type cytochrome [Pseudomonadota bacterium]